MKVKCIKDSKTIKKGFFIKETQLVRIGGISEGKIYEACTVSTTSGVISNGDGYVKTKVYFLLWDDDQEWTLHDLECFTPV